MEPSGSARTTIIWKSSADAAWEGYGLDFMDDGLDIGTHDGVFYLVMELLEGETLAERLERGPLAIEELLEIAIPLADALDRLAGDLTGFDLLKFGCPLLG